MIRLERHNPAVLRAALLMAGASYALLFVGILLAILPSRWVGTPYMTFAQWMNPGIDAPDNWAVAFGYFFTIAVCLLMAGSAASLIAYLSAPRASSAKPGQSPTR